MKTDITITRLFKVNLHEMHPFTYVEPTVSITLKDIDSEKIAEKTEILSDLVSNMLLLEIGKSVDQLNTIQKVGPGVFTEALKNGKAEKYEERIKTLTKELV